MSVNNNFQARDDNVPQKNIAVEVKSDGIKTREEVQKVVQQVLATKPVGEVKSISINFEKDKSVSYTLNGSENHKLDPQAPVSEAKVNVRIFNVATQAMRDVKSQSSFKEVFSERVQALKSIYAGLCNEHKSDKPPVEFLFSVLMAPLALLNLVFSSQARARSTDALPQSQGKDELVKLLEAHQKITNFSPEEDPHTKLGEGFGVKAQMGEALDLAKNPIKDIPGAASKVVANVKARLEVARGHEGQVNLAVIPAGFWKNGVYQPSLLAFYKNNEGKLCLADMSYGQKSGVIAREFVWENDPNPENMQHIVSYFLHEARSDKPTSQTLSESEKIGMGFLALEANKVGEPEKNPLIGIPNEASLPKNIRNIGVDELRENMIVGLGGAKPIAPREARRAVVSDDPWKLLHEALRLQFPEVPMADKVTFAAGVLNYKLEQVINDWKGLNPAEKKEWVGRLQNDYMHLQKAAAKVGEFDDFSTFKNLKAEIDKLNALVHPDGSERSDDIQARAAALDSLPPVQKAGSGLKVSTTKAKQVQGASTQSAWALTMNDINRANKIGQALGSSQQTKEGVAELQAGLNWAEGRMDELVGQGNYNEAKELYKMVMRHAPSPGSLKPDPSSLWGVLKAEGKNNPAAIPQFSKALAGMSKNFWEAKMKTWDVPLSVSEIVEVQNVEMGLVHLLELSRGNVLDKLKASNFAMPEKRGSSGEFLLKEGDLIDRLKSAGLNYDEICLLGAAGGLDVNHAKISMAKFREFNSLRTGFDLNADAKIEKMRAFVQERFPDMDTHEKIVLAAVNVDGYGAYVSSEASAVWQAFNGGTSDFRNLEFAYPVQGQPHIISQAVDFSRHQLMNNMLTHPTSSMYPKSVEEVEKAKAKLDGVNRQADHPDVSKELQEKISTMGRLELFASQGTERFIGMCDSENKGNMVMATRSHSYKLGGFNPQYGAINGVEIMANWNPALHYEGIGRGDHNNKSDVVFTKQKIISHGVNKDDIGEWLQTPKSLDMDNVAIAYAHSEAGTLLTAWNYAGSDENKERLNVYQLHEVATMEVGELRNQKISTVSAVSALNFICDNPASLNTPIIRARLISVLGQPGLIQALIKENPEYLVEISKILDDQATKAIEEGRIGRGAFTLQVSSLLHNHLSRVENRSPELNQALQSLPTLNKLFGKEPNQKAGWELMLAYANDSKNPEVLRMDAYSAILGYFSSLPGSENPENIKQFVDNPALVGKLLTIAARLKENGGMASTPALNQAAVRWTREVLGPWVFSPAMSSPKRNQILSAWVASQEGSTSHKGDWKIKSGTADWVGGNNIINAAELKIVSVDGKTAQGSKPALPNDVLQNPTYKALFGSQILHAIPKKGASEDEMIYEVKGENGGVYRILENRKEKTIVIEGLLPKALTGQAKDEWHRWENTTENHELKGIEKEIARRGMWVNLSDPKQGVAILADDVAQAKETEVLKLNFKEGKLTSIFQGDKRVISTPKGEFDRALSPLKEGQVLYLANSGSKSVNEIRLLGQNLSLIRAEGSNVWTVSEGDFKGYQMAFEGDKIPEAQHLVGFLGSNLEQCGMVLKHPQTGDVKVLLWPNRITSAHPEKAGIDTPIGFDKSGKEVKPLILSLGKNGVWQGKPAAFLQLAYLAAAKHEYSLAAKYLDQAGKSGGGVDKATLNTLMESFLEMPGNSRRSIAVKLRGILQIQTILRQQTQSLETRKNDKELKERIEVLSQIGDMFEQYSALGKSLGPARDEADLNPHEIAELIALGKEGFSIIRAKFNPVELSDADRVLEARSPKLLREILSAELAQQSLSLDSMMGALLVAQMKKPPENPKELLSQLSKPDPKLIIGNFFALSELIRSDKSMTPEKLLPLFGEIPSSGDKAQDTLVSYARSLLLEVASRNREGKTQDSPAFDLKALYAAHKVVPEGTTVGIVLNKVESFFRPSQFKAAYEQVKGVSGQIKDLALGSNTRISTTTGDLASALPNDERPERVVSVANLKLQIAADPHAFGQFTPYIADELEKLGAEPYADPDVLIENAKKQFDSHYKDVIKNQTQQVDIRLEVAEAELSDRARVLEKEFMAAASTPPKVLEDHSKPIDLSLLNGQKSVNNAFKAFCTHSSDIKGTIAKLETAEKEFKELFDKATDPLDKADKDEQLQGIRAAKENLISQLESRPNVIDPAKIGEVEEVITQARTQAQNSADQKRAEILKAVKDPNLRSNLPLALRKELDKGVLSDAELFEKVLNYYQKLQLQKAPSDLEKNITEFLIHQTEAQQLGKPAQDLIRDLKSVDSQDKVSYNVISAKLQTLVTRATDRTSYIDETGKMLSPQYTRKFLVSEYRMGVILRPEQIKLIKQIVDNPNQFYELRMGLGKTSYILPIAFEIMAEKGLLAVGLLNNELLNKGYEELDQSTRLMIEQAGLLYRFDNTSSTHPAALAEDYCRLLEVKKNQGYVITSLHSQAAIEHKLIHIALERDSLIKEILGLDVNASMPKPFDHNKLNEKVSAMMGENPPNPSAVKLLMLQKQKFWLSKTRQLLIGDKENLGFETQRFSDEADDTFNVLKEDNLALGSGDKQKIPIDGKVRNVAFSVMKGIFKSNNPLVKELANAISSGSQAALRPQHIREKLMPALVKEMLQDPEFRAICNLDDPVIKAQFDKIPMDELINYICDPNAKIPANMPAWSGDTAGGQLQKGVAILKGFVQNSIPKSLGLNPELDIGVKKGDGVTIGPRTRGGEEASMIYSDEFDIVANHYMQYAIKVPGTSFFQNAVEELKEKKPLVFAEIEGRRLKDKPPLEFLDFINKKENFNDRMAVFQTSVIENQLLSRFARQVAIPVQELAVGNIGGMTGTLNEYIMPDVKGKAAGDKNVPGQVHGEVVLRMAMQEIPPAVKVVADEAKILDAIIPTIKEKDCKFIISEGSALGGLNALQAVQHLRKECGDLNFVFTFPDIPNDSRSRKAVVWKPGEPEPQLITRDEVIEIQKNQKDKVRFFFGALDSRGTDYGPVEKGFGVLIAGLTTTNESGDQALYRERGLGEEHSVKEIVIPTAQANRIAEMQAIEPGKITWKNVTNDIRLQSLHQQKGKCLKSAYEKITSKLKIASRQIVNKVNKSQEARAYWGVTNIKNRLDDVATEAVVFNIFESLLIQSRETEKYIEALYATSKEIDIVDKVNGLFAQEDAKIDRLKQQVNIEVTNPVAKQEILKALNMLESELAEAKQAFADNLPEHLKKLPPKASTSQGDVASSIGTVSAAQAESVVSNQTENTVVTEETVVQSKNAPVAPPANERLKKYVGFDPAEFDHLEDPVQSLTSAYAQPFTIVPNDRHGGLAEMDCEELVMSTDMKALFDGLPDHKAAGKPIGVLALIGDKVLIMTKSDYEWMMKKEIENNRKGLESSFNDNHGTKKMGVVALMSGHSNPRGFVAIDQGKVSPDYQDPKNLKAIIKAKWLMGYSEYSEQEMGVLKNWLQTYDKSKDGKLYNESMKKFLQNRATDDQKALYDKIRGEGA